MAHGTLNSTRRAAGACLAWLSLAAGAPALADNGSDVARALGKESEVTVHLRSYYLNRDKPAPATDLEAWALGGWLGYQSGWMFDFLRVGAVGYTSQPLYAPDDKDGTLLLKPGQDGYSVLGQAYLALRMQQHLFTGEDGLIPRYNVKFHHMVLEIAR